MDKQPHSRAPLFVAIVPLLLAVLYLGSYLALVDPWGGYNTWVITGGMARPNYRLGGAYAAKIFWPLEQIHQRFRPDDWP